jgi:VWFA-related protein
MRTALLAALVVTTAAGAVGARPQATFRSQVTAVRLDVLVVNDGRPVAGLTSGEFEVFDNGVRQEVTAVQAESTPLDVVFALDRSQSVGGETLIRLKEAAHATLDSLHDRDRAALLTFSHTVSLDAPLEADRTMLGRAVDSVAAAGATAVVDAVYSALSVAEGTGRRTLVLVFSDGFDTCSWLTPADAVQAARESEVVISGVAFVPPEDRRIDTPPPQVAFMRRLTEASGGEVVEARRGADLAPTFVRILDTMRARYLLTYTPSGTNARGWHTLKVRLRHARGTVVVRPGYFGG